MPKHNRNQAAFILVSTPPIKIVRHIPYVCDLCGEDREELFEEIRGRVRCKVCGYPATVNEEAMEG